jgi:hypothetical protein
MSDGYVAFVVSILLIGALTAVIGDLSSQMGCTVGLKDSVTAIAFVALGTSIPGRPIHTRNQYMCIYMCINPKPARKIGMLIGRLIAGVPT